MSISLPLYISQITTLKTQKNKLLEQKNTIDAQIQKIDTDINTTTAKWQAACPHPIEYVDLGRCHICGLQIENMEGDTDNAIATN